MGVTDVKIIVEALLFAAEEPLPLERIAHLLREKYHIEINELKEIINQLVEDYRGKGVELVEVASGWRFQVPLALGEWITRLQGTKPPRYSKACLEVLALIAYRQPITRSEIEELRGVAISSTIVRTLFEHGWIRNVGRREVPGRPALLATTKKFLDYFNLRALDELPKVEMEVGKVAAPEEPEEENSGTLDSGITD